MIQKVLYKWNIHKRYYSILKVASAQGLQSIATNVAYALLPLLLTVLYQEIWAGIIISIGNLLTLLLSPVCGELANRKGALYTMRLSSLFFGLAGVTLLVGGTQREAILISSVLLFFGYGFYSTNTYVLQNAPQGGGGTLFGLTESIIAGGVLTATLLIPWFEQQAINRVGVLLITTMSIGVGVSYSIPQNKGNRKERKEKKETDTHSIFNIAHEIKKGIHFIKTNKSYPLFHLQTIFFEGIFYASIRFLFPMLIALGTQGGSEGITLGIYEIATIILGGLCGVLADKYSREKLSIAGRICIIIGAIVFFFTNTENFFLLLIISGILIGIGNNVIFGASSHILEECNHDHEEDGSFVALQKVVENIGYILMPLLLGFIVQQYSIIHGIYTLAGIIIIIALSSMYFLFTKKRARANSNSSLEQ